MMLCYLKEHAHILITLLWWVHSCVTLRLANRNKMASTRLMTVAEHETMSIYTAIAAYGTLMVSTLLCIVTYLVRSQP